MKYGQSMISKKKDINKHEHPLVSFLLLKQYQSALGGILYFLQQKVQLIESSSSVMYQTFNNFSDLIVSFTGNCHHDFCLLIYILSLGLG
jgi:hypothetical protein